MTRNAPVRRRRPTAAPAAEPELFANDHVADRGIRFESQEAFFAYVRRRMDERAAGGSVGPLATLSFESVGALLEVLTPRRYALIQAVKAHGGFESIEALAQVVQRDRAAVSRDLKCLAALGLVRVTQVASPGHGRRTEIAPAGIPLRLEIVI